MSLMRRTRGDLGWPEPLLFSRRLLDRPDRWADLFEGTELTVEEFDEDGTHVVRVEAPGIDPDADVEITMVNDALRIEVERREENRTEDKRGYRSEFRYGSFSRTVPLPAGASDSDVKATYHDGVLEVRVPIDTEQAGAKKIPIARP